MTMTTYASTSWQGIDESCSSCFRRHFNAGFLNIIVVMRSTLGADAGLREPTYKYGGGKGKSTRLRGMVMKVGRQSFALDLTHQHVIGGVLALQETRRAAALAQATRRAGTKLRIRNGGGGRETTSARTGK